MAKDNIEKTVIVLEETEVREALNLTHYNEPQEIFRFVSQVIAKKVESVLRRRCG
jgi:hypothetical protein